MREVTETSMSRRQARAPRRGLVQMPGNKHCTGADLVVVGTEETRRCMLAAFLDPTGSCRRYRSISVNVSEVK